MQKKRERITPPKWSFMADYRGATDLQDQTNPRIISHALAAGVRYHLMDHIYLTGGITAAYDSAGMTQSEILVDGQHAEGYMGDITLGVSSSFTPTLLTYPGDRSQSISWSIDNEFPTSPYSRAEGYYSITDAQLSWSFDFFERFLFLIPNATGYYIWNTYEKSPTTQTTNKMGGVRLAVVLGMRLWQGLFTRVSAGVQSTRYTDGSTDATARNSIGIGYTWPHVTVSLDYSNGTYADREETHLWFIDHYRRIISLRTTLSF